MRLPCACLWLFRISKKCRIFADVLCNYTKINVNLTINTPFILMATKRPTRPTRDNKPTESWQDKAKEITQASFWQRIRAFFQNERVHFAFGIIVGCFSIYTIFAFVSFFFTGKADFSILELPTAEQVDIRHSIRNWAGLEGASLVHFLVDSTFGLASIALMVMGIVYALTLMRLIRPRGWKFFFCSIFWLLWISVTLGFLQHITGIDSFFRWGGAHGEAITRWMTSYVQIIGELLIMFATLIIFLLVTDKETIPRLRRFGCWIKEKCNRNIREGETIEEEALAEELVEEESVLDQEATQEEESEDADEILVEPIEDDTPFEIVTPINEEDNEEVETPSQGVSAEEEPIEMEIETTEVELSEDDPEYYLKKLGPYDPRLELSHYQFPSMDLLRTYPNENKPLIDMEEQKANQQLIINTFRSFGIEITNIKATIGPTVTLYEIVPKEGTRISKIQGLEKDIMLSLSATGIRMIAPMPGKGTIGIEVPNKSPQTVSMHSVIASRKFQEEQKMRLPIVMGKTITNDVFMFDLAKAPHLLVAGATGQGKSVGLNAIITSLLYKKHPSELKLVLVDPKMVEFSIYKTLEKYYMAAMPDYEDIIITDCTKVINTLNSLVIEMEERYTLLMDATVRNLEEYNEKFTARRLNPEKDIKTALGKTIHHRYLPYIVIVIDEFGDFIMQAGKEVERPIARITQKARAVGMHMILATQRPSVNIITGVIKANIPTRIAFRCQALVDSRTVLDAKGAEGLVGKGDMLYSGGADITRIQCAFVDTPEVEDIVKHIGQQQSYAAPYELPEYVGEGGEGEALAPGSVDLKKLDPMFADVARYVVLKQEGSTSKLQRAFSLGYNRAGKLSDQLEAAGIVGPNKGPKGRDVLIQDEMQLEQILRELL